MADSDDGEGRAPPSRPMSAMGIEIEPDLEAPLLGTLESSKPPSRVAPLLVLLGTYAHSLPEILSPVPRAAEISKFLENRKEFLSRIVGIVSVKILIRKRKVAAVVAPQL